VKPSNILVAEDSDEGDHVLVTDFGIARALDQTSALTNAGSIAATLPFASPEQIAGRELDHRSDVYSLGCTLYVMLTGSVPFPRDSQIAVMHAHLADPPPQVTLANRSLPTEMDDVIARAMAKDPDHRYRSCRELAFAAQAALSDTPAPQTNWRTQSDEVAAALGSGTGTSAGVADTVFPDRQDAASGTSSPTFLGHPRHTRKTKRTIVVCAAVLAVVIGLVVAGRLVFGGERPDSSPASATSTVMPEPTDTHSGPWQAYDFVATALPSLMPETPSGASYLKGSCQAINARFEPIDQLGTGVPVARILCTPAQPSYIANYVLICSSDRTPQTLIGVADGLTAVRNESWSREGGSGQTVYGDHDGAGALAVSFDSPSRNFCLIVVNGNTGTSGQDVHDHWFRDAPL
jgi:serine/threonine protein kinase